MMSLLLGFLLLASSIALLRVVRPKPDGSQPSVVARDGMGTFIALLFTVLIAGGLALLIQGIVALI